MSHSTVHTTPESPRLLLISADLKMRALAEPALTSAGFRVRTASSAQATLDLARQRRPDVILLDLLVDDADALHLRAAIRDLPFCQTTPIFIVSDLIDRGLIDQVYKDSASEFLAKPVNWMVLPHRLRQAVYVSRSVNELHEYQRSLKQAEDVARTASTEALKLRNFDQLTGLPNRTTFNEIVALAVAQMQNRRGEIAVLYVDIDGFKELNDSLGRDGGDHLLRAMARRLHSTIHERVVASEETDSSANVSLARIQADEFAVLLDSVEDASQVERTAEGLLASLTAPYRVAGRDVFLSASIGIALVSESEGDAVLQCAETAMQHAKRNGGKTVRVYRDSMKNEVIEKLELQQRLRKAIQKDELRLHYQPIINATSGHIDAVEGLVRWTDLERGPISPAVFIPVAEEAGLIVAIGDWVLSEGCRQLQEWSDLGLPPVRIAINIARQQLEEDSFVEKVQRVLRRTGIEPACLELELSERGVLRDDPNTLDKLHRLRALGVTLAIDDFGTGQTTLAYLQKFPLSVLKIDRSFVSRIAQDAATEAITRAIVAMSHELGLRVVGEGVETDDQARILRDQNCDELQGFLYFHPLPAQKVGDLLDKQGQATLAPESLGSLVGEAPHLPTHRTNPDTESGPFPTSSMPQLSNRDDELFRMAHVDYLTDLLNRYSFERTLESTLARAQRFGHQVALLLFDLDEFKDINDSYGHSVGDELLVTLAARMKERVREVDALARLGGDEFALIHSEFDELDGVATLAQRIGEEISKPVRLGDTEIRITASTGIAVFPPGDADPKRFYEQADLALYKAKEDGGNRFHFHATEMDHRVQQKLHLSRDLKRALDRGELHLVFQPQFSLTTRSVAAVEALVRWNHPTRGLVPPDTFIPIAEESGEIVAIGEWILRNACAEAGSWSAELGREIPVSVNLSYVQFRLPDFPQAVERILNEAGLPAHLLELELNQRMLLRFENELERLVRSLCALGVGLSIDDFGTSPFSIEDLSHLPFSKLKVEGRYVRASKDGKCQPLVRAMIALGKKLNLGVVAEGVETQDQLLALQNEDCDFAQGHLFTKPMTAPELKARLLLESAGPDLQQRSGSVLRFPPKA